MLACCLALIAVGNARAPAPSLTLERPAVSLRRLLLEVSDRTGGDLRCDDRLASEILVTAVQSVPVEEFLDRLAAVVGAHWRDGQGYRVLSQTSDDVKEEEKVSLKGRVQAINAALERGPKLDDAGLSDDEARATIKNLLVLRGQMDAEPTNDTYRGAYASSIARSPMSRSLALLVRTIPPEALANIGRRSVFSLHPTSKQGRLGTGAEAIFDQMRKEQSLWAKELAQQDPDGRILPIGTPLRRGRDPVPPESDFRVIATEVGPGNIAFELALVEPGSPEVGEVVAIWQLPFPRITRESGQEKDPAGDSPITLSHLSSEFAVCFNEVFGQKQIHLPADLRAVLLDPVAHDPLQLLASDCLIGVGRVRERPLIAWVSDSEFFTFNAAASRPLRCRDVERLLEARPYGLALREEDGWLLGRPTDPVGARRLQTNREALGVFARAVDSKGRATLRDYAAFAQSLQERTGHLGAIPMQFLGAYPSLMQFTADWEGVRVFGALTDDQVRALEGGRTLRYGEAPPRLKELIAEWAFSREIQAGVDYSDPSKPRRVVLEPTVTFASGIPGDTEISLENLRSPTPIAFIRRGETVVPFRGVSPSDIAGYESPSAIARYGGPFAAGYAMGQVEQFHLRVRYSDRAGQEAVLSDFEVDDHARPVPWNELPDPVATAVREIVGRQKPPPVFRGRGPFPNSRGALSNPGS